MSDDLLIRIAPSVPAISLVAIYLVGLFYAVTQRKHYPKAAWLAVAGLGALTLTQFLILGMQFLPEPTADQDIRTAARRVATIGWVSYALYLSGSALLIWAVFAGRRATTARADA